MSALKSPVLWDTEGAMAVQCEPGSKYQLDPGGNIRKSLVLNQLHSGDPCRPWKGVSVWFQWETSCGLTESCHPVKLWPLGDIYTCCVSPRILKTKSVLCQLVFQADISKCLQVISMAHTTDVLPLACSELMLCYSPSCLELPDRSIILYLKPTGLYLFKKSIFFFTLEENIL